MTNLFSHLKILVRSLTRHKFFTFVNVFGLSIGFASCLIIFSYVLQERSFDKFHSKKDNIYRINTSLGLDGREPAYYVNTSPALAPGMRGVFPEVDKVSQMRYIMRSSLTIGEQTFLEDRGYYADSVFLEIFDFELKYGDPRTALDEPNSIIISTELAQKYFGTEEVLGRLITLNREQQLVVTGVSEPVPYNSHLQFDLLISFSSYRIPAGYVSTMESWYWVGFLTYVQLKPNSDYKKFNQKLQTFYDTKVNRPNTNYGMIVQPLGEIYFESSGWKDDLNSKIKSGNKESLGVLTLVAIVILLIASFNFMNLSMAKSLTRIKEIGVRKVLGAGGLQLFAQIILEYLLICAISILIAFVWVSLINTQMQEIVNIRFNWSTITSYWITISVSILGIGLLTGIYPALMLMRMRMVQTLKNKSSNANPNNKLRNFLVLLQFAVSMSLITGSIVMYQQMDFIRNFALGVDKESVALIHLPPNELEPNYVQIREVLLQNPNVVAVSKAERLIGEPWPTNGISLMGNESDNYRLVNNLADVGYLETLGIELEEGRDFILGHPQDSLNSIILNRAAVEMMGLEDPIGQQVNFFSINGPRTIIGVVEDFHFATLHEAIGPMVLVLPFVPMENILIRLNDGQLSPKINSLKKDWASLNLGIPLDLQFMDDEVNALYQNDQILGNLILIFTVIAIILSGLGLLGLVSILVNHRMREIAIRRVLGASVISILQMMNSNFLVIIGIATLLSAPLMSLAIQNWLNNFAYKVEINPLIYFVAPVILLIVGVSITSLRTLSGALSNPVDVLKEE